MKTVKNLLKADGNKTLGNHSVVETSSGRDFIYFSTVICSVNDIKRTFRVDNGGYSTPSTARAISSYRYELRNTHKEILELEVVRKKRNGVWMAVDQIGKEWEIDPQEYTLIEIYKGKKYDEVIIINGKLNIPLELVEVQA
jgi:hypothetical protein